METRSGFHAELDAIKQRLLEMGALADAMLNEAVAALMAGDADRLEAVEARDAEVDRADAEVEMRCLLLIATQQPVARDLRFVGTAVKVTTDVERIADYAVDLARIGLRMGEEGVFYRPLVDLPRLASLARGMLRDALQAFVAYEDDLVRAVIAQDDVVDSLYHRMRDALTRALIAREADARQVMSLLFAVKSLERAADHAVNMAERVHFLETGEVGPLSIRHTAADTERA